MYYKKIVWEDLVIEFDNSWTGEETIFVNGQVVSKQSSIMGTHHYFSLIENGQQVNYVLTTKVNSSMQVFLDLRVNGALVKEDIPVPYGGRPKMPKNTAKIAGVRKTQEYELEEAIADLRKALEVAPNDPEIYFHLACAYSVQEDVANGFECIRLAVANRLQHTDLLLQHDMLAYLRLQSAFAEFAASNFLEYQLEEEE